MSGEGGSVGDKSISGVIECLRALVAAIDEGRIEATAVQRAYLEGAVDTLRAVSKGSLCDEVTGARESDVSPAR